MAKICDVAQAILDVRGPMTTMKLQKLAFYSQAYSLASDGQLLTPAKFEAWVNGPVSPDLYRMHRGKFMIWAHDLSESANARNLSNRESRIVTYVVGRLGDYTGEELRELSHREKPWIDARKGLSSRDRGTVEITPAAIKSFYSQKPSENPLFQ